MRGDRGPAAARRPGHRGHRRGPGRGQRGPGDRGGRATRSWSTRARPSRWWRPMIGEPAARASRGQAARPRWSRCTRSCTPGTDLPDAVLDEVRAVHRGQGRARSSSCARSSPPGTRPGCWPAREDMAGAVRRGRPAARLRQRRQRHRRPATGHAVPRPRRRGAAAARVLPGQRHRGGHRAVQRHRRRGGLRPADRGVRPASRTSRSALSTSGNSENLLRGLDEAARRGHAHRGHRRLRRREDGRAGQPGLPVRRAVVLGAPDPGSADHHLPRAVGADPGPLAGPPRREQPR